MADAPITGQNSITNTTAVALSTSGGGTVLIWIIRMFEDGKLETPSAEVAMTLVAFLAPFLHAISRIILHKLGAENGAPHNGA